MILTVLGRELLGRCASVSMVAVLLHVWQARSILTMAYLKGLFRPWRAKKALEVWQLISQETLLCCFQPPVNMHMEYLQSACLVAITMDILFIPLVCCFKTYMYTYLLKGQHFIHGCIHS